MLTYYFVFEFKLLELLLCKDHLVLSPLGIPLWLAALQVGVYLLLSVLSADSIVLVAMLCLTREGLLEAIGHLRV